jgi:hypothetical protein
MERAQQLTSNFALTSPIQTMRASCPRLLYAGGAARVDQTCHLLLALDSKLDGPLYLLVTIFRATCKVKGHDSLFVEYYGPGD